MYQILVAEDESRIAAFIEKGLRSHGLIPTIATDADEAISLALKVTHRRDRARFTHPQG